MEHIWEYFGVKRGLNLDHQLPNQTRCLCGPKNQKNSRGVMGSLEVGWNSSKNSSYRCIWGNLQGLYITPFYNDRFPGPVPLGRHCSSRQVCDSFVMGQIVTSVLRRAYEPQAEDAWVKFDVQPAGWWDHMWAMIITLVVWGYKRGWHPTQLFRACN